MCRLLETALDSRRVQFPLLAQQKSPPSERGAHQPAGQMARDKMGDLESLVELQTVRKQSNNLSLINPKTTLTLVVEIKDQ